MDVLKILGNKNRRRMLKILAKKSTHISALARELNISVPVALQHVRLLESASLVEREHIGNADLIKIREKTVDLLIRLEDIFDKPTIIKAKKGETLYKVLKRLPGIRMKKWAGTNSFYVFSIDEVEGYYIFLVNGKLPEKSVDKLLINDDLILEFQKLIPVLGRRIEINISK